jgi:hypothetical protein
VIAGAAVIFAGIVAVLLSRFFEEKISMAMIFCSVAALAAGLFIIVSM